MGGEEASGREKEKDQLMLLAERDFTRVDFRVCLKIVITIKMMLARGQQKKMCYQQSQCVVGLDWYGVIFSFVFK